MIKRLFFDIGSSGHHAEFFENVIGFLDNEKAQESIIIASPIIKDRLQNFKKENAANINLIFISEKQLNYIYNGSGRTKKGFRELEVLKSFLDVYKPAHIIFLNLGVHLVPLAFLKLNYKPTITGIYLNNLSFVDRGNTLSIKRKIFTRKYRQLLNLRIMFLNKCIKKIYILNDQRAVGFLNSKFKNKFEMIHDPLPANCFHLSENFKTNRVFTFLMIGQIQDRKGVIEFLNALEHIKFKLKNKIKILFAGPACANDDYGRRVISLIEKLKSDNISFELMNKFVDPEDLTNMISNSDCILAAYKKHFVSSGALGYACRFQKPLLVNNEGFLGEFVNENKIGLAVDAADSKKYSMSLIRILNGDYEYNISFAKKFSSQTSPKIFVEKLITL